jgi:hypothetical protein
MREINVSWHFRVVCRLQIYHLRNCYSSSLIYEIMKLMASLGKGPKCKKLRFVKKAKKDLKRYAEKSDKMKIWFLFLRISCLIYLSVKVQSSRHFGHFLGDFCFVVFVYKNA